MIRKLVEADRNSVLEYLSDEPSINLFLIGDIETAGFDTDYQTVWGEFDDNDNYNGVLLKYNENFIPYTKDDDFDLSSFRDIILNNQSETMVSGKESILKRLKEILPHSKYRSTYFCELTSVSELKSPTSNPIINVATTEDAERIYDLVNNIDEFDPISNHIDRIKNKIETGAGRVYYIEDDNGKMISLAQTTAENSKSAMIVGVATLKDYRGKGLVSQCLSKLCIDVMDSNKTLCLFYDNPDAGKIYHRLGFKTIDNWVMMRI